MRRLSWTLACGCLCLLTIPASVGSIARTPGRPDGAVTRRAREHLANISIPFVPNLGQTDPAVAYYAQTFAGTVFVTRDGRIVYSLPGKIAGSGGWALTEAPVYASGTPPAARKPARSRVSYFLGDDPSGWRSGIPTYEDVSLEHVWPDVTLSLRAYGMNVEKFFTIEPGGDPSRIRMRMSGARSLATDDAGDLVASVGRGSVRWTRPAAYQQRLGERRAVAVAYEVRGDEYGFRLGAHDPDLPVVIDPLLQATYVGGGGLDSGFAVAIHPTSGDVYVAGRTDSTNFPGTTGGAQASNAGGLTVAFVARLNADLKTLTQATYLGGSNGDQAFALAIHPTSGDVYLAGDTDSPDFPGTAGGAQAVFGRGNNDAFVARLTADLKTLTQSTYLGGGDYDEGVALAIHPTSGEVYLTGRTFSTDFPGTAGGAQTSNQGGAGNVFVARLNAALTALAQSTYLGGGGDLAGAVAIHPSSGDVYVTGYTLSSNFPGVTGGAQAVFGGGTEDAFVARLNAALTTLTQSTYLGGSGNELAFALAIHPTSGDVYVAGQTSSTDLPGTAGGAQASSGGYIDAFVARLTADLKTLTQSTYLGGSEGDVIRALAIRPTSGDVYAAGDTDSTDFPGTAGGAQAVYGGDYDDAFVARLNADLKTLTQSTYLGGSNTDESDALAVHPTSGDLYVAGETHSTDFPGTAGGAQASSGGGIQDAFVARMSADLAGIPLPTSTPPNTPTGTRTITPPSTPTPTRTPTVTPTGTHPTTPTPTPTSPFVPTVLDVDSSAGATSDGNGVFEPGETVVVAPTWKNAGAAPFSLTGAASSFSGPSGATYSIVGSAAGYGSVALGASSSCAATGTCYSMFVSSPATRPAVHWDSMFTETLNDPMTPPKVWILHLGDSFTDVPRSYSFYRKIETIFHNKITVGCTATTYCPTDKVPRSQMAIFIARGIAGGAGSLPVSGTVTGQPYNCTSGGVSVFSDVSPTDIFCRGVHYIAAQNVTTGCAPALYCPFQETTRAEMAIFIAKGTVAPAGGSGVPLTYGPDPVTGSSYSCDPASPNLHFTDISVSDKFCKHAHFLWARGIIVGCSKTQYCPTGNVGRDEMSKFLANAFRLLLYGP